MDEPRPQRPWWQKKRWPVVAIVWLLLSPLLWPFLLGPMGYVASRGWIPAAAYDAVKRSLAPLLNSPRGQELGAASGFHRWHLWWQAKARPDLFGRIYDELYGSGDKPDPDQVINRKH